MKISCGNVWARVEGSHAEMEWLDGYLSIPLKSAKFTASYRSGFWDGRFRVFDRKEQRFPTGLVRPVLAEARERNLTVVLEDVRMRPKDEFDFDRVGWLRDYQREALGAFLKRTRGIVKMPTGSGKTEVFCALANGFPGLMTLVMVDTADLMHQAADRYERRTGRKAGRFGDGSWSMERFTVATMQALNYHAEDVRVRQLIEAARILVVDEVHVLPAETYSRVAAMAVNAYWRMGTSATPIGREDERDFAAVGSTGPLCHEVAARLLVEAGVVVANDVVFVRCRHPRTTGKFPDVYDALVAMAGARNNLVRDMVRCCPTPALVFFKRIPHGKVLKHLLEMESRVELVDGKTADRAGAVKRLERGDVDCLVTSRVFNKGIDIPRAAGAVNAAGGASAIDALQRMGRGSRAAKGKDRFLYMDVMDEGVSSLQRHARVRLETYRAEGHRVQVIDPDDLASVTSALRA